LHHLLNEPFADARGELLLNLSTGPVLSRTNEILEHRLPKTRLGGLCIYYDTLLLPVFLWLIARWQVGEGRIIEESHQVIKC
jgi:hypothetical protein